MGPVWALEIPNPLICLSDQLPKLPKSPGLLKPIPSVFNFGNYPILAILAIA
jgi:hypothetical protein